MCVMLIHASDNISLHDIKCTIKILMHIYMFLVNVDFKCDIINTIIALSIVLTRGNTADQDVSRG